MTKPGSLPRNLVSATHRMRKKIYYLSRAPTKLTEPSINVDTLVVKVVSPNEFTWIILPKVKMSLAVVVATPQDYVKPQRSRKRRLRAAAFLHYSRGTAIDYTL